MCIGISAAKKAVFYLGYQLKRPLRLSTKTLVDSASAYMKERNVIIKITKFDAGYIINRL